MFEMTPEGRKRVDRNDAVRQTVPEFGSTNRESPATDSRQLDWWHHKTAGVSRTKYMGFRLVPKWVTLNDLEQRYDRRPALSLL